MQSLLFYEICKQRSQIQLLYQETTVECPWPPGCWNGVVNAVRITLVTTLVFINAVNE